MAEVKARGFDYPVTLLEIQKLVYFLVAAGEPMPRVEFRNHHDGPYADALRHVFDRMDGHFVTGYGDGDNRPDTAIRLLPGAAREATGYLEEHPATQARFERVAELIEGFETPFGMELLATVHWVARYEGARTEAAALSAVRSWSPRKAALLEPAHVAAALDRLREAGWFDEALDETDDAVEGSHAAALDRAVASGADDPRPGCGERSEDVAPFSAEQVRSSTRFAVLSLPPTPQVTREVVQRIGQERFRAALVEYWSGRCAVTGLDVVGLLRASHIKPWAACSTDHERLDPFNGLLLAPQLDAAFDGGWITFEPDGSMLISERLSGDARGALGIPTSGGLSSIETDHERYLRFHRRHVFEQQGRYV